MVKGPGKAKRPERKPFFEKRMVDVSTVENLLTYPMRMMTIYFPERPGA